jgi:hypothetical protein
MDIGESQTAVVLAKPHWNSTGIQLRAGERYSMIAAGRWADWFIPHGPEGDPSDSFYMKAFEPFRRMKNENWFALIGAFYSDIATTFPIGKGRNYDAQSNGELTCFANDVEGFYFNNYGQVTLSVTRTA